MPGGCFAVQQVDTTPKVNTPGNIATLQTMDAVLAQVQQNQADFGAAVAANQAAGSTEAEQNAKAVESILANTIVSKEAPQQTPTVVLGGAATETAAPAATTTAATTGNGRNGNGNGRNQGNRNQNNNNNNKRGFSNGMRWAKRYVVAGQDFTDDSNH